MSPELHVLFKVAESDYVVAASNVLHMESFTGATRVPGTQPHVIGLVQIRQRVVPVIDLRVRFGLPVEARTLDARIVVVQVAERAIGLLVDSAREVLRLAPDAFAAPPEVVVQRAQGFVSAVARAGARMVMLIDLAKVIGEEELGGEQRVD
jgi:purine-binding chemotaxis protein CheW